MNNIRNEELQNRFGRHLCNLRKSKGLTQKELAFATDVSISQISRIERGLINPTLSTLHAIAESLEISLEELVRF